MPTVKLAAAHASPIFLDTPATLEKTLDLITEAAGNGADLIAFPETFIPAFPVWSASTGSQSRFLCETGGQFIGH